MIDFERTLDVKGCDVDDYTRVLDLEMLSLSVTGDSWREKCLFAGLFIYFQKQLK